jgi:hypothetical protein
MSEIKPNPQINIIIFVKLPQKGRVVPTSENIGSQRARQIVKYFIRNLWPE